jgi:hypothetical protein
MIIGVTDPYYRAALRLTGTGRQAAAAGVRASRADSVAVGVRVTGIRVLNRDHPTPSRAESESS